jgi:hypothetical protein
MTAIEPTHPQARPQVLPLFILQAPKALTSVILLTDAGQQSKVAS